MHPAVPFAAGLYASEAYMMHIFILPTRRSFRVFAFRQVAGVFLVKTCGVTAVGLLQGSRGLDLAWPLSRAPATHGRIRAFHHRGTSAFSGAESWGHGPVQVTRVRQDGEVVGIYPWVCGPVEVSPCVLHIVGATKPGFRLLTGLDVQEGVVSFLTCFPQDRWFPASCGAGGMKVIPGPHVGRQVDVGTRRWCVNQVIFHEEVEVEEGKV
ncbi:hypothetical protein QAD02_006897 [Eretmocerus hayati]|uniref:Uncharacterized protein n=1 Tax=Eretmocerus hayati TaxID=131215 RepID=A0ACC2N6K0_9HYME|nr:hypothetical protein QAD02_006897 [Eretmocerus hayati]